MLRVLVFLVLLGVAASAAVWLAGNPETIAFTWQGREYSTSLAVGMVAIVVFAMLLAALWLAIRALLRLPSTLGRQSRERRQAQGRRALSRGLVAVGSGDAAAARRYAGEAERLIGHEPLTLLLRAQAAQASGDRPGAEAAFRRMTEHRDTRVLGLRGLFIEAQRRGDAGAARAHAEEAALAAPSAAWANDAVLEGYSASGEWPAAIAAVERRASTGLVDRATSRRQRAVLHAAAALSREGEDEGAALASALEAVRLAPDLVPAAALAGRLLARKGDLRRASKIVETAWQADPHPDLAAAYLGLRPGDSAADRLRRGETLARLSSWSAESRLALARAALDARDPGRARDVLRPLLTEGRPSVRTCLMMADLEELDGAPGRVREWLARASRAPRDKAWIADGVVSDRWAPVSPVTGRLDAFAWATPPDLIAAPADEPHIPSDAAMPTEAAVALDAPAPVPADVPPAAAEIAVLSGPPAVADEEAAIPVAPPAPRTDAGRKDAGRGGGGTDRAPPPGPATRPDAVVTPLPVTFPVSRPPDDPGLDAGRPKARSVFGGD